MAGSLLPDGLVAVVKRDCPTCVLVAPVLSQLAASGTTLTVYSQDDPSFPPGVQVIDDTALEVSFGLDLVTVPTLIKVEGGVEAARLEGWSHSRWQELTGVSPLGDGLPE